MSELVSLSFDFKCFKSKQMAKISALLCDAHMCAHKVNSLQILAVNVLFITLLKGAFARFYYSPEWHLTVNQLFLTDIISFYERLFQEMLKSRFIPKRFVLHFFRRVNIRIAVKDMCELKVNSPFDRSKYEHIHYDEEGKIPRVRAEQLFSRANSPWEGCIPWDSFYSFHKSGKSRLFVKDASPQYYHMSIVSHCFCETSFGRFCFCENLHLVDYNPKIYYLLGKPRVEVDYTCGGQDH